MIYIGFCQCPKALAIQDHLSLISGTEKIRSCTGLSTSRWPALIEESLEAARPKARGSHKHLLSRPCTHSLNPFPKRLLKALHCLSGPPSPPPPLQNPPASLYPMNSANFSKGKSCPKPWTSILHWLFALKFFTSF